MSEGDSTQQTINVDEITNLNEKVAKLTESDTSNTSENKMEDKDGVKDFLIKLDLPEKVMDIIYWKNKLTTPMAFFCIMILLHAFGKYRFHLVICTLVMSAIFLTLTITLALHLLKNIQKLNELNPIPRGLAYDLHNLDKPLKDMVSFMVEKLIDLVIFLQGLTFVKDLSTTIKTFVLCYLVYAFNGFVNFTTLLELGVIVLFIYPYVYSIHHICIDGYFNKVSKVVCGKLHIVEKSIPPNIKDKLIKYGIIQKGRKQE